MTPLDNLALFLEEWHDLLRVRGDALHHALSAFHIVHEVDRTVPAGNCRGGQQEWRTEPFGRGCLRLRLPLWSNRGGGVPFTGLRLAWALYISPLNCFASEFFPRLGRETTLTFGQAHAPGVKAGGRVYLVGAGPGDERLITLRGLDCIKVADVIVFDRLVNEALLERRKPDCECIYVGKSPEGHTMSQEEINQLLVRLGREGKTVVRLKGGDPFLFGRGGEEALELARQSIPFEVVPGVSSALAAPTAAGIPITHRGVSASVTIATGHEDPAKGRSQVEWEKLAASAGTLVILMGVGNIARIVERVMAGGRPAETPVAVIRCATTAQELVLTSTLGALAEDIAERQVKPPAVIVIGEVVRLRDQLALQESKPLAGKQVLVTRPSEQAGELADILRAAGAEPVLFPLIRIVPEEDTSALLDALQRLDSFDWTIFTSANGVRAVAPYLEKHVGRRPSADRPKSAVGGRPTWAKVRVAAIGPRTAQVARELGFDVAFVPTQYAVEAIVREFPEDVKGRRILLLRAREANPALPHGLRKRGAEVEEITVYHVESVDAGDEELRKMLNSDRVDIVTLTSSSTVRSLLRLLGDDAREVLRGVRVACLGHVTAQTFQQMAGRTADVQAREYTMKGLVRAIIEGEADH